MRFLAVLAILVFSAASAHADFGEFFSNEAPSAFGDPDSSVLSEDDGAGLQDIEPAAGGEDTEDSSEDESDGEEDDDDSDEDESEDDSDDEEEDDEDDDEDDD